MTKLTMPSQLSVGALKTVLNFGKSEIHGAPIGEKKGSSESKEVKTHTELNYNVSMVYLIYQKLKKLMLDLILMD